MPRGEENAQQQWMAAANSTSCFVPTIREPLFPADRTSMYQSTTNPQTTKNNPKTKKLRALDGVER